MISHRFWVGILRRHGVVLAGAAIAACVWRAPIASLAHQNAALIRLMKLYERGIPEQSAGTGIIPSSEREVSSASVSWLRGLITLRSSGDEAAAAMAWQRAAIDNARRLSVLGVAEWNQGRRRRAVDYARLALKVSPANSDYPATLMSWLIGIGELNQAARDLDDVLREDPDNAAVLACRGYVAFRQGSAADARQYLDRATSIAPDDRTVISYLATFLMESRGPEDQLEAVMRRGDLLYGDFHHDLAKLYITQKRYREAAPYVTKLLAERADDAYALEIVGGYYFSTERYREALGQYEAASRMVPTEPRFFINVGQAQMALGNRAAAVDAYCAAMPLDVTENARELLHAAGASCSNQH